MSRFDPSRFAIPGLALLSLLLLLGIGLASYQRNRKYTLTIAAGARSGESYVLAQALKTVTERHHRNLRISVRETAGTSENLALLERREVQLAAAQADVPAGPSARLVALLYVDVFQLLVHHDSSTRWFPDLAGKRIALPRKGGQYQSFLKVAEHFGLSASDFKFLDEDISTGAFVRSEADAVFRVRALGNPAIRELARNGQIRLVGVQQAAAMRITIPSLEPAVIPEGAYRGNPPIPDRDLPTVGVQRMLAAHADVGVEPIRWITSVLIERREELAHAIPNEFAEVRALLAGVRQPDTQTGLGAGVHPGAQEFFDRDKPSFVQKNADFVALLVTLMVLSGSWLWELKRWIERRQKNRADQFTKQAVELMNHAQAARRDEELEEIRTRALGLLAQAVHALDVDQISEASFQSFRAVLGIALDVIRERRAVLV